MAPPPSKRPINTEDIPDAPDWVEKLVSPLNAFIQATGAALDRGSTFREQFAGQVKVVDITPPDDWVPLTLSSRWTAVANANFKPPPAYRQTLDGEVILRGLLAPPTTPVSSEVIASKLPLPEAQERHIVDAINTPAYLETMLAGTLTYASGSGPFYSLTGVRYGVADRTPPRWDKPLTVKLGTKEKPYPGRPGTVLVLNARRREAPLAAVAVQAVDWVATTADGSPAVHIWRVWGLDPGVAYSLTLAILPE